MLLSCGAVFFFLFPRVDSRAPFLPMAELLAGSFSPEADPYFVKFSSSTDINFSIGPEPELFWGVGAGLLNSHIFVGEILCKKKAFC